MTGCGVGEEEHELTNHDLQEVSREGFELTRVGQQGTMRIRRFLLLRKENSGYARHGSVSGGIGKTRLAASGRSQHSLCFASIFGTTLKNILDFSGVATNKKAETVAALHEMLQYLGPVGDAVGSVAGPDQPHLVNGLATHKVSCKQSKLLPECSCSGAADKNSWLRRTGLKNVTMGVTAAVLVAHYVMANTGSDPAEVTTNLGRCIGLARDLLDRWHISSIVKSSIHRAALGAEIRALERARAAARAAEAVALVTGLDRMTTLHLQLSYMRTAAWPSGTVCCAGPRHDRIIIKLRNGEPIADKEAADLQRATPYLPSIPILQLLTCVARNDEIGSSSGSEISSVASSAASSIGSEDLEASTLDAQTEDELASAVAHMRTTHALATV